ncbi:hypothetical protein ACIBJC_15090 [Streptomyces sp. NPDC050509]|uniref:hypothetical protein n=1 Tax=Streptomyces sp. NPDC050509 TaxID=3365620 RepID=UPI00379C9128
MTTNVRKRPPAIQQADHQDDLRHYRPEELVDPTGEFRLPTTARMLREWAYKREIPFSKLGGKITFRREHVRVISQRWDVPALAMQRVSRTA